MQDKSNHNISLLIYYKGWFLVRSGPFLVTGCTGTAVFFLVLKLGGTSEKNHPAYVLHTLRFAECGQHDFYLFVEYPSSVRGSFTAKTEVI